MNATSIKRRLVRILSSKQTGVVIFLSAIIGRLIQIIYFFNIRVDASYQTIATRNLIGGHGVTLDFVLPSNLSTIIYQPLIKWPPGFSLLLAPFYILSGKNYIIAGLVLHSLSAIALIFYTRAILQLFKTPLPLINVQTVVAGFFVYSFYFIISSDAISTTLFIAGLYYCLSLLRKKTFSFRSVIFASICLALCAWTKYLLIPVVFIVPIYFIAKGLVAKSVKLTKAGLLLFLILFVSTSSLLLYQKSASGSAAYVAETGAGFFLHNLLEAYPVFPAAFLNPDTLRLFTTPAINRVTLLLYQSVYLMTLASAGFALFQLLKRGFKKICLRREYLTLFLSISFALISVLAILSLSMAKGEEVPGMLWTYIQEPRYYGPIIVLMHLSLFILYSPIKKTKYVFYILLLLLSIETSRGIIFDLNRLRLVNKEEYSWQYEDRFQNYANEIIKNSPARLAVKQVVVTGSSYYMNNRVSLYSQVPVLTDATSINDLSLLQTKKPALLLVIIHKKDFPQFHGFLSTQKEIAGKFDDYYFYTVYVQPH